MLERTAADLGRAIEAGKAHPVELLEAQLAGRAFINIALPVGHHRDHARRTAGRADRVGEHRVGSVLELFVHVSLLV
jgi:hypothetical protein